MNLQQNFRCDDELLGVVVVAHLAGAVGLAGGGVSHGLDGMCVLTTSSHFDLCHLLASDHHRHFLQTTNASHRLCHEVFLFEPDDAGEALLHFALLLLPFHCCAGLRTRGGWPRNRPFPAADSNAHGHIQHTVEES